MQIDVPALIGATAREIENRQRDGQPVRVVIASRSFDTDVADLWDCLTSPERIPRWFLPISGELKLGGHYQLEGNAGGTITECEPPRRLAATWEYGGAISWVAVRLAKQGEGARLTLEHIFPDDDKIWAEYGPAVGVGWDLFMLGLALHLASGEAVDKAEVAAWTASDDGKAFIQASADGWCGAHVASGEDAATARAKADLTAKSYQGG